MQDHGVVDPGRSIDWGKTSQDYAKYRPGPPASLYEKLRSLDVGLPHQSLLDLGTGTGIISREWAARGVSRVCASDISEEQVNMAKALALNQNLNIEFKTAPAESQPWPDHQFDVITANQCWLYFDKSKVIPEVKRLLKPGGVLVTSHFSWLPRVDAVARRTEELILKHNPSWTAANYSGDLVVLPKWADGQFKLKGFFWFDEQIPFDHDMWRGRIRASRGVGAALSKEEVARFDQEHAQLLREMVPDKFNVLHRIDAAIYLPIE